jgi:hypothetical protein
LGLFVIVILVVERQVTYFQKLERELGRAQLYQCIGKLSVNGIPT